MCSVAPGVSVHPVFYLTMVVMMCQSYTNWLARRCLQQLQFIQSEGRRESWQQLVDKGEGLPANKIQMCIAPPGLRQCLTHAVCRCRAVP